MTLSFIVDPLPMASITASATASGSDPAFMGNDYMGVVWNSGTGATSRTITVDMGADVAIDFGALLGCTGAAAGWTLQVSAATAAQGSSFAATVYSGPVQTFLAGSQALPTGRGIGWWSIAAPVTARYWRLTIAGLGSSAVIVGRLVLGAKFIPEREFVFGASFGVRDLGDFSLSPRGVPLWRRNKTKLRTIGLSYSNLYRSEVESIVQSLLAEVGNEQPVFLCTDATANAGRQRRCYFGPLQGDLSVIWKRANGFEWPANIVSLI